MANTTNRYSSKTLRWKMAGFMLISFLLSCTNNKLDQQDLKKQATNISNKKALQNNPNKNVVKNSKVPKRKNNALEMEKSSHTLPISLPTPQKDSLIPVYTRAMWLADSFATADLVVVGTPRRRDSFLDITKILYQNPHTPLSRQIKAITLIKPYRVEWEKSGVWILLQAPKGYFAMNPTNAPLALTEWSKLKWKRQQIPPNLEKHITKTQIYRTYRGPKSNQEIWHGVDMSVYGGLSVRLMKHGAFIFTRCWDRKGRLTVVDHIAGEDGYAVKYYNGRARRFNRYKNGKKDGIERTYFKISGKLREEIHWRQGLKHGLEVSYDSESSKLREEIHWRQGVKHGSCCIWDAKGNIKYKALYEDGFVAPVIRYKRKKKGRASIHKSEYGIHYQAPDEIIDALKIGMTSEEVSNLLKLDFSEKTGLHFPCYFAPDTDLEVRFKDGKIFSLDETWNGSCLEPEPELEDE